MSQRINRKQKNRKTSGAKKFRRSRRLRHEALEDRRMLATLTVNANYDDDDIVDNGTLLLREAIAYIQDSSLVGPIDGDAQVDMTEPFGTNDTIIFDVGLNGETITMGKDEFGATISALQGRFADLNITKAVTIDTRGVDITIDASGTDPTPVADGLGSRVFEIDISVSGIEDKSVTLRGLRLTGGDENGSGGAISFDEGGSGAGSAILNIENSEIFDNNAHQISGGALSATGGVINIAQSIIRNNTTLGIGGGVHLGNDITSASLEDTEFIDNEAGRDGGGLWVELRALGSVSQEVTIERSEFLLNKALGVGLGNPVGSGGAIHADLRGDASTNNSENTELKFHLIDSTVDNNNFAEGEGGGVWVCTKHGAEFNARGSTISNNTTNGDGGGLWMGIQTLSADDRELDANLTNLTLSGNTALSRGGGAWIGSTVLGTDGHLDADLNHLTIYNNFSPMGGGLFSSIDDPLKSATISTTLRNTIVSGNKVSASNSTASNIDGVIDAASDFNEIGPGVSSTPDTEDNDPGLMALADNGGPTLTHKPTNTSPVVDAGDPNFMAAPETEFDQRGADFTRVVNAPGINDGDLTKGPIDIGAVELRPAPYVANIIFGNGTGTFNFDDSGRIGSGEQVIQLPLAGIDTVTIEFSEPVDLPPTQTAANRGLRLLGAYGTNYALNSPTGNGTATVTWQLSSGTLPDVEMVLLELSDEITDLGVNALDGEWVNPESTSTTNTLVSEFPSGDGVVGGDFHFAFVTRILGDFDGNNHVGNGDLNLLLDYWGQYHDPNSDWITDLPTDLVSNDDLGRFNDHPDGGWFDFIFQLMGDADGDYAVGNDELTALLDHWGLSEQTREEGDTTNDGLVNNDDLTAMLDTWGLTVEFVG